MLSKAFVIRCEIAAELPPPCENLEVPESDYSGRDFTRNPLKIFYVGGLGGTYYYFPELAKAVNITENCELKFCCKSDEWELFMKDFALYM